MGDIMRPVPFGELLRRVFDEFKVSNSIFEIPQQQFYRKDNNRLIKVFGETCETPIGPAAGPHTQLAQNIIVAWLTGGRFIELKTVQILDRLEIEKPCIDAEDECFNTEWSTEFTLKKAYDEYLKAWFILYLLEEVFDPRTGNEDKSFIFNMSVGYNLEGIKEPPMQEFIHNMMESANHPKFVEYRNTLTQFVNNPEFIAALGLESRAARLKELPGKIPSQMVHGVTLSTMHGCPPHEIEAICQYMMEDKGLNTFVKLNPTLLGYPRVREILDTCGFDYVALKEESFAADLRLDQALGMLQRLMAVGEQRKLSFGVKLTNTLGTVNDKGVLPDKEMYMSGRALYPLSINVAALLSREFKGKLSISYSGGASKFNIKDIFETGIRPITMATDLLKPGGYLRQVECMRELDSSNAWEMTSIDVEKLNALAEHALTMDYTQKEWKTSDRIDAGGPLPLTDCYVAPCVTACAIHQDIPEYIRLVGEGRHADALEVIYQRNALPAITGHICDHQCQYNCTRLDYEKALNIRDIKKIAVEKGWNEYAKRWHKPAGSGDKHPVAVVGAGPAGLSAGYFLARAGHPVTIFEREANAGGVVKNIIPQFRIPAETIQHDIDFVVQHGVKIEYNCDPALTVDKLQDQGFKYVCVGIGTDKNSGVRLEGDNRNIYKSLPFLRDFNKGVRFNLGSEVAVIGAGNTAMDCARAALRVPGVKNVTVLYRRSIKEMPAWREEYEEALEDGVKFMFLTNPETFNSDGTVVARVMTLGEPDAQGRRSPVATDKTVKLNIDAVITAIGEQVDCDVLSAMGVPMGADGWPAVNDATCETSRDGVFLIGDVQSGPSSIVAAIGGARKASDTILARENKKSHHGNKFWLNVDPKEVYGRKGMISVKMVDASQPEAFAAQEAQRCLECNYVCSKCVDV
ncbi:MAG: putative selenate reductase subunit YgfK, partial [Enterobacteriaceae bacterium]